MNRVFQSILGVVLLGVAGTLAIGAVTSKGAVVMEWPLASIILAFAVLGGFLISKSLMVEAIKTVSSAVKKAKP